MSNFIRDRDAHTRGVNAIAAVDGVGNRLRRIEQVKVARMNQRDLAMARMANDAFRPQRHPLAQLGAVNLGLKVTGRSPGFDPNRPPPLPGPHPGNPPRPPRPSTPGMIPMSRGTVASLTSWAGSNGRAPGRPDGRPDGRPGGRPDGRPRPDPLPKPTADPADAVDPIVSDPTASSDPAASDPMSSRGSSSGATPSSATSGGGYSSGPPTDEAALTDLVTSTTDAAVTEAAKKKPNYLLYAGIALGAYLLLRKKG